MTERDESRAMLAQQATLEAEAERINRSAIDRCVALAERVAALTDERDEARRHTGTLLAIVERVADRLTTEEGAVAAVHVAEVARFLRRVP